MRSTFNAQTTTQNVTVWPSPHFEGSCDGFPC